MSASSKKKLRNAAAAEKLTERQLTEQKEAKKLKLYTTAFVVVIVALLVIALTVGVYQIIAGSGIRERNSIALTIGDETINAAEMSYYYVDSVQTFASNNSSLLIYMLDTTVPLDEQVYNPETGATWADYFLETAQASAQSVYAVSNAAEAAGYTLPENEQLSLDSNLSMVELYAQMYGYADADAYLKAIYGNAANMESYREYNQRMALANSYSNAYAAALSYDDATLREAESDNYNDYSSFTFHSYYIAASRFLEGGTEGEDGTVTYSDEEKAAAAKAAEEAAASLTGEEITSVEALDQAIGALPINADTTAQSSENKDVLFTSIDADIAEWLTGDRKEGDVGYIVKETSSASGEEVITTVDGYYVLYFVSKSENKFFLPNVRHILIGSQSVINGETTYTEEELVTYKAEAEALLEQWKAGDATEESFAELASQYTMDTGSATNGGLYENIIPSQMVEAFDSWCFDNHIEGDTGIIETEYGYHIMYFCGMSELNYRDLMISDELATADMEAWYADLQTTYPMVPGDTRYLPMDYVISG